MARVHLTRILKLEIGPGAFERVLSLWERLPAEAKRLTPEDLHVTLVHQKVMKPIASLVGPGPWDDGPTVELDDRIFEIVRPDRRSWIALVKNQGEVAAYVSQFMGQWATGCEPDRVYHVSLANLDGSPFASVGDVRWDDVGGRGVIL